ncbi:MAG TPA: C25 family cysteine peptidase [Candidatus Methylomirabilis sp.]|nr:C25 family cysteine peptidase [Candidatus Methylomirabilis sp.]
MTTEPVGQDLTLTHLDPAPPGDARLEVVLQGLTEGSHTVGLALNGIEIGSLTFAGQARGKTTIALHPSQLQAGSNQVSLVSRGGELDVSAVDTIRLTYWHTYTADDDQLRCTVPGGQMVTLTGFSNPRIGVVDITDPQAPQRLSDTVRPSGTGYTFTFSAPGSGGRILLAFAEDRTPAPAAVIPHQPSDWHQPSHAADLVMISHPTFLESARPLQALHEGQGMQVALINVEALYAEFSFGAKTPWALRAFLQQAATRWQRPPRFALLLGGASVDPKNFLGFGDLDFVPTKLVDTTLLETASDDWFADFSGSGVPAIAIGRLPVRTVTEAATVVQKLVTYAQAPPGGPASTTALLVADGNDEFNFEAASSEAATWVPPGLRVQRIDTGQLGFSDARRALLGNLNEGPRLVHYIGHGSVEVWDGDGLLSAADADTLTNGAQLPLVVAMTCLNGLFQDPGSESLAAALLTAPSGGAVAVWASSGLTEPAAQAPIDQAFLQRLGTETGVALGEAARAAKAATSDLDVSRTWIFFGDPALRWVPPPAGQ